MRTSSFQPSDVPVNEDRWCGAVYPYNDLPGDEVTCVRPTGHEWEHACLVEAEVEGPKRRQRDSEWVWWRDPVRVDYPSEEARLQATAYVAGNLAREVARHEAILAVSNRVRMTAVFMLITILLAIYGTLVANRIFLGQCVQRPYLGETRAAICDRIFPGDAEISPGRTTWAP